MERNDDRSEVPQYDDSSSDSSTDSGSSFISSKEVTATIINEEYEDDADDTIKSSASGAFYPLINCNIFVIERDTDSILIGLRPKLKIYISGVFQLQIVKGGIVYNNAHHDASRETFTLWHPICNAIPAIQSSYFSDWKETSHLESRYRKYLSEDLRDFDCVIKVRNAFVDGLLRANELFQESKGIWGNPNGIMHNITSDECTYCILREGADSFAPLFLSDEWSNNIGKITSNQRSLSSNMRLMVLGGKNSGKSTVIRALLENLMGHPSTKNKDDCLYYFDLDPGQPEYSAPECISLTEINCNSKVRGSHLGQPLFEHLKQYYIGSNSPQDVPDAYLKRIDDLMQYFEEQAYVGTSFVNLPGWFKGFGITIFNHVILKYKPTHIIFLETNGSKRYFEELEIPSHFTDMAMFEYDVQLIKLKAHSVKSDDFRFNAAQLRTYKTLAYFHTSRKDALSTIYDFQPLIKRAPLQLSYGDHGIKAIQFFEEFRDLNGEDIKCALEGTVVGLHSFTRQSKNIDLKHSFPIIEGMKVEADFLCLALIHSIDVQNMCMNIYVPEFLMGRLNTDPGISWMLLRGKTETPLCELFPPGNVFSSKKTFFISTERRKKYEHVWKVRKNVQRRGHHM